MQENCTKARRHPSRQMLSLPRLSRRQPSPWRQGASRSGSRAPSVFPQSMLRRWQRKRSQGHSPQSPGWAFSEGAFSASRPPRESGSCHPGRCPVPAPEHYAVSPVRKKHDCGAGGRAAVKGPCIPELPAEELPAAAAVAADGPVMSRAPPWFRIPWSAS